MPRYELSDGSSNKFWDIRLAGKSFTTTFGKIGATGQTQLKQFSSDADAKAAHDKVIAEKVKKGYALVGAAKAMTAKAMAPLPKGDKAAKAKPASAKPASASGKPGARYFEFVDGGSSKFWEIRVEDTAVTTRYGKIGSTGQETLKDFDSKGDAFKEYDKLVTEKTKKGYVEQGAGGAAAGGGEAKRNPELEKAIDLDPYDTDAYSVYADWLQDQGDPRGELIALQLANKESSAKPLLKKQSAYFLGALADHQKTYDGSKRDAFTWKYGFIHALRLSHNHYADESFQGSLAEILDLVLRHPSGRFLAEITFVFNNDPNDNNLQDLIDLLAKRAPATLRKLHIGDYKFAGGGAIGMGGDDTEISWYSIGNLGKLWKATPKLRSLITQGGSEESAMAGGFTLGTLDLPELVHAEFRTGGLEKAAAKAIVTAKIPRIEHLDIWFGEENYGGSATVKEVQVLLARTDLPKLRHLGLMNSEFADALPGVLAKAKLVGQLKELNLSMGTMTDDGAHALAAIKSSFKNLELLDVSNNYLSKKGIAALKGFAKTVITSKQREDDDPEYRHPAVGE